MPQDPLQGVQKILLYFSSVNPPACFLPPVGNCVRIDFLKLHVMIVMYLYNVVTFLRAARKIYVRDMTNQLPAGVLMN